jgi:hypothetical protein
VALLFDPGVFMPRSEDDFAACSWVVAWSSGPWHLHDVRPGGTVLLVDASRQRIVWHTRVTRCYAVPYEGAESLAFETKRRWNLLPDVTELPPQGFAIGWQAEPVERLDRGPLDIEAIEGVSDSLDLTEFRMLDETGPFFRRRWQLDDLVEEPDGWCAHCWRPTGWSTPVPR